MKVVCDCMMNYFPL